MDEDVLSDARLCEVVLGEPLTAYLADAESVGQYRNRLFAGGDQLRRAVPRLAAARRVILAFQIENAVGSAAAWLRGFGSASDVPARMIREQGDDETLGTELAETAGKWLSDRRPERQYAA